MAGFCSSDDDDGNGRGKNKHCRAIEVNCTFMPEITQMVAHKLQSLSIWVRVLCMPSLSCRKWLSLEKSGNISKGEDFH